jgi:methionyl-tRNA formyltransferase
VNIIFFGTAEFGIPVLKAILNSSHKISAVITAPPKPTGRGLHLRKSPINNFADENLLSPIFTPDNFEDENFIKELKNIKADIFLVVAFSILPKTVFEIPKNGTYNIHASLLPQFRGPAPIQRAIESGAKKTGVSVFRIDSGVDTGDIVIQKECEILDDDTTPSLYEKLSVLGATAFIEAVKEIEAGSVEYKTQNIKNASKAPLLRKEESIINWRNSAVDIANKVRAFKPFPTSITTLYGRQITIEKAFVKCAVSDKNNKIGEIILINKNEILVQTGDGILTITELKPAGKRAMSICDYANGNQIRKGMVFE